MSNKIKVDTTKIDECATRLYKVIQSINSLDSNLNWYIRTQGYNNIFWTLNYQASLGYMIPNLNQNLAYLQEISTRVNFIENALSSFDPLTYTDQVLAQTKSFSYEVSKGMIGEVGILGKVVKWYDAMEKIDADATLGDYLGATKATLSLGKKVYDIGGDAISLGKNFGFKEFIESGFFSSDTVTLLEGIENAGNNWKFTFGDAMDVFNNDFSDELLGDLFKSTEGIKCVADWVGLGLDFGISAYENYEEHGEVNERMISETLIETTTDATISAGLHAIATTAGTALAAVLVGTCGAPAAAGAGVVVVAGAVGAGIKVGADWVTEKIWGKKISEIISDAVYEAGYDFMFSIMGEEIKNDSIMRIANEFEAECNGITLPNHDIAVAVPI